MNNYHTRGNFTKSPNTNKLQTTIEQHLETITKLQDQLANEEHALMMCLKQQKQLSEKPKQVG